MDGIERQSHLFCSLVQFDYETVQPYDVIVVHHDEALLIRLAT